MAVSTVQRGIVSYLVDPDQGLQISQDWVTQVARFYAPEKIVRVSVTAARDNTLPMPLYASAIRRYAAGGISVGGVLELGFNQPWLEARPRLIYPNDPLGYQGNKRQNRYIKDLCVRAGQFAKVAVPAGMDTFWIGNEYNLEGSIPIGANVPPVATDKAPACSPEVAFSAMYEVAGWLKASGAKQVYMGALSLLPQTGTDANNPYIAGYIRRGMQYLHDTGVRAWPFDGIALNMEGLWSASQVQAATKRVRDTFAAFGCALPLIISEWGTKNSQIAGGTAPALATYQALHDAAGPDGRLYFFSHNLRLPHDLEDFGCEDWTIVDGQFVFTGQQGAWSVPVRQCYGLG